MICSHCNCDKLIPRDPPLGARGMKSTITLMQYYCYHCENYRDEEQWYIEV